MSRASKKGAQDARPKGDGQQPISTNDAFQNVMARLGFATSNMLEGTNYPLTRLTRDYNLMNSLYRSHWLVRRIIDTIPQDMFKNWIEITTQLPPNQITRFNKVIQKTKTRQGLLSGMKWGRLYGGAAAIMLIKGHEGILSQPLDLDDIMPDSYKGLLVFDRWSGISPSLEMIEDISDPDFGLPQYYRATLVNGRVLEVHSSRVIRFTGRDLPQWEKQAEVGWGVSEVELLFDELKKRDNTSWNIASLVFLANVRTLKIGNLAQSLAVNSERAQQALYNTLQAQNHLMSNMGIQILNKEDDFQTHQFSFSGLNEIYQSFMMDVAGASETPVTKLFGRSPAGMNATGESDLQNYYDMISEKQESDIRPRLDKLFPVIEMSTFGKVNEDFEYKFLPAQTISVKDLAEITAKKTGSVIEAFNASLLDQKTGMMELRQMGKEIGLFTNITDESIDEASDELLEPGELGFGLPVSQMSSMTRTSPDKGAGKPAPKKTKDNDFVSELEPTEGQRAAGNYKKGHIRIQGLDISIENPIGSIRKGADWEQFMMSHYGYIKKTVGSDNDHVDSFVGPNRYSEWVFIVDQIDPKSLQFDEHKVMIGYDGIEQATNAYLENYPSGWSGMGAIWVLTMDEFKQWLKEGNTTKPYGLLS